MGCAAAILTAAEIELSRQAAFDRRDEFARRERLLEAVVRADQLGDPQDLIGGEGSAPGHRQDARFGLGFAHFENGGDALFSRHQDIDDDEVGVELGEAAETRLPVKGGPYLETMALQ